MDKDFYEIVDLHINCILFVNILAMFPASLAKYKKLCVHAKTQTF